METSLTVLSDEQPQGHCRSGQVDAVANGIHGKIPKTEDQPANQCHEDDLSPGVPFTSPNDSEPNKPGDSEEDESEQDESEEDESEEGESKDDARIPQEVTEFSFYLSHVGIRKVYVWIWSL
jgi:hypothetical protein